MLSTLGACDARVGSRVPPLRWSPTFGFPYASAQGLGNTLGLFNLAGNGGPGDPAGRAAAQPILGFTALANPFNTQLPRRRASSRVNPQPVNGIGYCANGVVSPDLLTSEHVRSVPKFKGVRTSNYMLNWAQTVTSWLKATVDAGYSSGYQFTQQNYNDATPENISPLISSASRVPFHAWCGRHGGR